MLIRLGEETTPINVDSIIRIETGYRSGAHFIEFVLTDGRPRWEFTSREARGKVYKRVMEILEQRKILFTIKE